MKNLKSIFAVLTIALLAVTINFTMTSKTYAMSDTWDVTCNYDENGNFTGGTCESMGIDECNCPKTILDKE